MDIMHYVLGIPPVRGGGLLTYAIDLAEQQAIEGKKVGIIYPGHFDKRRNETYVRYDMEKNNVLYFEIVNPLPVPMGKGILDVELFISESKDNNFLEFIKQNIFGILHIHSLMGMHKEFLKTVKDLGIKIIFTSHDYFGICPKPDLFCFNNNCGDIEWKECKTCCAEAYSYKRMKKEQSRWYVYYKKFKLIDRLKENKWLFDLVQKNKKKKDSKEAKLVLNSSKIDYSMLQIYYKQMFEMVDMFHFNSSVAMEEYTKRIDVKRFKVINISHKRIDDKKKYKEYEEVIKFGYLGNCSEYKGFFILVKALKELDYRYRDRFCLNVYFDEKPFDYQFIKYHQHYNYNDLNKVMEQNDIIIVPSTWRETYGFVVLEALSHGVPVLVSENVGAKDLLGNDYKFGLVTGMNVDNLKLSIKEILDNTSILTNINKNIVNNFEVIKFNKHVHDMFDLYKEI